MLDVSKCLEGTDFESLQTAPNILALNCFDGTGLVPDIL